MTKEELAEYNVGENLDTLMNLDPRGYGICRILYSGSRKYAGNIPVAMNAAKKICSILDRKTEDTTVLIMTGFVLRPHLQPETDGIVGALLLARALIWGFGITPVLCINPKNVNAVIKSAVIMGLHVYDNTSLAQELPVSFSYVTIPEDSKKASEKIDSILSAIKPALIFSTECAGANEAGQYHNAVGKNMTEIESKQDALFNRYKEMEIPTFAVGDLGNEIGMGAIKSHIEKYIPYSGGKGVFEQCQCNCKDGIVASTEADYLITATVSDWGVYAVIAAIAFLRKNIKIMHSAEMEENVLKTCCLNGMVDMTGSLLPAIDGFDVEFEKEIVSLMRSSVEYAMDYHNDSWFEAVLHKGFYV